MPFDARLVVTDSGLGGLAICADLERRLRTGDDGQAAGAAGAGRVHLTYVNAWPFEGRGYNDLPDLAARAGVFDRALDRMASWQPARVLIACNTLSIIYGHTAFSRAPRCPVDGIIDAGVRLFAEAMATEPSAGLILLGTKTTIESGVHAAALVDAGVDPHRIRAVHCHGLAGAIERDPHSAEVADLIAGCAARVRASEPGGVPLYAGLCCTHYGYVADRIRAALEAALRRPIETLDPNLRMLDQVRAQPGGSARSDVSVEVLSKVSLGDAARHAIAGLVAPVSPATAQALLSYAHVPDLF